MWRNFPKHYFGLLIYFTLLEFEVGFCAEETITAENLCFGHHSHPELVNLNLHQQTIAALGPPAKKPRLDDYSHADNLLSNSQITSSSRSTCSWSTFPDFLEYFEQNPVIFQESNWPHGSDEFTQDLHHPSWEETSHHHLPMEYSIATAVIAKEPLGQIQDKNTFPMLCDNTSSSVDANNLSGLRLQSARPTSIT